MSLSCYSLRISAFAFCREMSVLMMRIWTLTLALLSPLFAGVELRTEISGNGRTQVRAVAPDTEGNVYLVGETKSGDFPVKQAFQASRPGGPLMASDDGGVTWRPLTGLGGDTISAPRAHPNDPRTLLALKDGALWRSTDGGVTWVSKRESLEISGEPYQHPVVRSPAVWSLRAPGAVFVASSHDVYKSTDGGETWVRLPGSRPEASGTNPTYEYEFLQMEPGQGERLVLWANSALHISDDHGATWRRASLPGVSPPSLAMDAEVPGRWLLVYQPSYDAVFRTTDSGQTWTQLKRPFERHTLVVNGPAAGVFYIASQSGVAITFDGGDTWAPTALTRGQIRYLTSLAVDPHSPGRVIASGSGMHGESNMLITEDGGRTWQPAPQYLVLRDIAFHPAIPGLVYGATWDSSDGFAVKVNREGSVEYATYLGGVAEDSVWHAVAGSDGSLYVAGYTWSPDFPKVTARYLGQDPVPGAFLAKLDRDGQMVAAVLLDRVNLAGLAVDARNKVWTMGCCSRQVPLTPGAMITDVELPAPFLLRFAGEDLSAEFGTQLGFGGGPLAGVAVDSEGFVAVAGDFNHPLFGARVNLLTVSPAGGLVSSRALPALPERVVMAPDGRVFVTAAVHTWQPEFAGQLKTDCPHDSGRYPPPVDEEERRAYMADVWVAGFSRDLSSELFSRVLGGSCRDTPTSLSWAAEDELVIGGMGYSQDLPSIGAVSAPPVQGLRAPFAMRVSARDGRLESSTYVGAGWESVAAAGPDATSLVVANWWEAETSSRAWLWKIPRAVSDDWAGIARIVDAFSGNWSAVAPGQIVRVEAPGFVPRTHAAFGINPSGGLPREVNGTGVRFAGIPAPLVTLWDGVIECIVPQATPVGESALVTLEVDGEVIATHLVSVMRQQPGLYPEIRNEDGSVNSKSSPARSGRTVSLFFSGLPLPRDAGIEDGERVETPLSTIALMSVVIGNRLKVISFPRAAAIPGFVFGFWEVQASAPDAPGEYEVVIETPTWPRQQITVHVGEP